MKRWCCIALAVLVLLGCLFSCDFLQDLTDTLEESARSPLKVEEMLAALSESRIEDAKALLHPQEPAEGLDASIEQMAAYLDGRKAVSMALEGINVNTSVGTSGRSEQEDVLYRITLDDSTVLYVNAVYLSDGDGSGFSSFRLVLGVV